MTPRARRRVETGFKSLREFMAFSLGAWIVWFQMTRTAQPDFRFVGAGVVLILTPTGAAAYRLVNWFFGPEGSRTERDP